MRLKIYFFISFFISIKAEQLTFMEAKKDGALNIDFLKVLKKCFNTKIFIETGTYLGLTSINASQIFDQVVTIELDQTLFYRASNLFKNYRNIKIYNGDSKIILNNILHPLTDKILFFLDAHWSMGWTAKGEENTPILKEIECIKKSNIKNAVILIDDLRFFQSQNLIEKEYNEAFLGYPTIDSLYQEILKINSNYELLIYGDLAIAYLKTENVIVSNFIKAMTISRMSEINSVDSQVMESENIIAKTKDPEKAAVFSLMNHINTEPNLTQHYRLWLALILLNQDVIKSFNEFRELIKLGFNELKIIQYKKIFNFNL